MSWCAAVSLAALLCTAACTAGSARDDGALRVVATMTVLADFAAAVGGDAVSVESLVPVGGDPHVYEPTPSDAVSVAAADVVFDNGLGLSPWFDALAAGARNDVVVVTTALEAEVVQGDRDRADPHLWMVPPFVATGYVAAMADALALADPARAAGYHSRADGYARELAALDTELRATLGAIPPERRLLVTSHDAYRYFAEHYDFEVIGTVLGVSTDTQPSAEAIAALVDTVRASGVPTIFIETTVNPAVVERVAADAGVAIGAPLYGDSLGLPGSGADHYAGMMRANAAALVAGLAQ